MLLSKKMNKENAQCKAFSSHENCCDSFHVFSLTRVRTTAKIPPLPSPPCPHSLAKNLLNVSRVLSGLPALSWLFLPVNIES